MTKSGRKKLVIELQYLGTAYDGWQPQPNQSSVYDVVAAALHETTGETHGPVVAGRTDKGVHAKHQLVSVRTERSHDHEALVAALNAALPKDVRVLSAHEGPATFHATTSVRRRRGGTRARRPAVRRPRPGPARAGGIRGGRLPQAPGPAHGRGARARRARRAGRERRGGSAPRPGDAAAGGFFARIPCARARPVAGARRL